MGQLLQNAGLSSSITATIGRTPLVKISRFIQAPAKVCAKLELLNPLFSVKDRIGASMIEAGEKEGKITPAAGGTPSTTIIEPTSGNTGISLAFGGAAKGYKLILTMPESMSMERRAVLKHLGASLVLTPAADGMPGAVARAEQLAPNAPNGPSWSARILAGKGQVEAAFRKAMAVFEDLGASVEEVSVPEVEWTAVVSAAITTAEAAAVHGDRVVAEGERFDPAVRRRIETGFFVSAPAYVRAQRARVLLTRRMTEVLDRVDLIAMPTVPMPAPLREAESVAIGGVETPVREALLRITRIFNVTRMPAVSVPCGFSADGLPLAFQIGGRAFDDAQVLRAAHAYQGATDWHTRRPPEP